MCAQAQMQAFRQWLVHDLDAESFADVYAQTIVYGMFAARFHDTTPEDFSRAEAATLIPRTNPLLCVKNKGCVYINSTQCFDNVPTEAWEFFVGGYQPAQKWLKDRKGRALTSDDLLHYKAIISALVETRRLMGELAGVPLAAKLGTLV